MPCSPPQLLLLLLLLLSVAVGLATSSISDDGDLHGFDDEDGSNENTAEVIGLDPFQINVDITYCELSAGRAPFDQVKMFLENKFPNAIVVTGRPYPLSRMGRAMLYSSYAIQGLSVVLAFAGDQVIRAFGLDQVLVLRKLRASKMQVLAASFLFNAVAQSFAKTDAFEISINGDPVFSKLASKRMPTFEELASALAEHGLNMKDGVGIDVTAGRFDSRLAKSM